MKSLVGEFPSLIGNQDGRMLKGYLRFFMCVVSPSIANVADVSLRSMTLIHGITLFYSFMCFYPT